jgi:hypothetical protein
VVEVELATTYHPLLFQGVVEPQHLVAIVVPLGVLVVKLQTGMHILLIHVINLTEHLGLVLVVM